MSLTTERGSPPTLNNQPLAVKLSTCTGVVRREELFRKPDSRAKLRIQSTLDPHVGVMRIFPGITDEAIRSFLAPPMRGSRNRLRQADSLVNSADDHGGSLTILWPCPVGVVVQTYGSGNAPDDRPNLLRLFHEATARGVILVNCTQCPRGSVSPSYR
jgi:lysophospholipase